MSVAVPVAVPMVAAVHCSAVGEAAETEDDAAMSAAAAAEDDTTMPPTHGDGGGNGPAEEDAIMSVTEAAADSDGDGHDQHEDGTMEWQGSKE